MLPVIILCGGLGTRLQPVVSQVPKVLAPVGGEPFLGHLLRNLRRQGCTRVILSEGYRGEAIQEYAGDGKRWGLEVEHVREPEPLGTAGAIRFTADALNLQDSLFVLNGDTIFTGSLEILADFHRSREGACGTVALVRVPEADRYGTVVVDDVSGEIVAFREKEVQHRGAAWINAGTYVLTPALIKSIPAGQNVSLERDVFPAWTGKGLYACRFPEAQFLDIGTPGDYSRATEVLEKLWNDRNQITNE